MRTFARLGFSTSVLRRVALLVAWMTLGLSSGALQFADGGCSHGDEVHAALSHQHQAHEHQYHGAESDELEGRAIATDESDTDTCPPFCGDCQDCAGCFHPVAVAATPLLAKTRTVALSRAPHRHFDPARPPRWEPPSLLHVPRAA